MDNVTTVDRQVGDLLRIAAELWLSQHPSEYQERVPPISLNGFVYEAEAVYASVVKEDRR